MIDATWIDQWAKHYGKDYDTKVLKEIGPRVHERGYYDREDLLTAAPSKRSSTNSSATGS